MTVNRLCLYNDQEEAMRQVLDTRQAMIWTALPAIVTAVNFDEMTCFINNSGNSHIMYEELFEFFTDYIWVMVSNYLEKSPISKGIENENNN